MSKNVVLMLFTLLTLSSLVMVDSVFAQSIPKPSVPEFALRYIDLSYDVPPTYGIDQFTGETVITQEGYHVENQSVTFKIKNQPFTSYNDSSNNIIALYYNFRFKGHYGNEWQYYPFSDSGQGTRRYSAMFYVLIDSSPKLEASNSQYTDIFLGLPFLFGVNNPTVGNEVDFQVQALIGHIDYEGDGFYSYTGQRSDWSNTQTITVGESQTSSPEPTTPTSPTPLPSEEPQSTDQELILGIAITITVLAAGLGLLLYLIKRK